MRRNTSGWVRLYREITSTDLWDDPDLMRIWTWILLNTVWDDERTVIMQGIKVPYGHVLGSYRHIARQTAYLRNNQRITYPTPKVGRLLKKLESQGRVQLTPTESGQLIKVINWDKYNSNEGTNGAPPMAVQPHTQRLWEIWVDRFCERAPYPTLNRERARCLNMLYLEQLEKHGNGDYTSLFNSILDSVKASPFHNSKREYLYPESLFRNESRREKWALEGVHGSTSKRQTADNFVDRNVWRPE